LSTRRQTAITAELEAEEELLHATQKELRSQRAKAGHKKRRQRALSQWFTNPALARRMMMWVQTGGPIASVIEPSAGEGALVAAMPAHWQIVACEIDGSLLPTLSGAHPRVAVLGGDFFAHYPEGAPMQYDIAILNQPTERQQWAKFMHRALDIAKRVVSLCPTASEHGATNGLFWARAQLDRKVILEKRPGFGGRFNPQRDYIIVDVSRRTQSVDRPTVERWRDL
jgi:predicted RNA methylase